MSLFCTRSFFHEWKPWSEPVEGEQKITNLETYEVRTEKCWVQIRRCAVCNEQRIRRAR